MSTIRVIIPGTLVVLAAHGCSAPGDVSDSRPTSAPGAAEGASGPASSGDEIEDEASARRVLAAASAVSGGALSDVLPQSAPGRRFARGADGRLVLVVQRDRARTAADARRGITLAEPRFAVRGEGGVTVAVPGRERAWIDIRPAARGGDSRRAVVDGRIVYPEVFRGVDAIYAPDAERVEEWLLIRDRDALHRVAFEANLGPELAGLRVDASGAGLEAFAADGSTLLRAPMPEGVDARGVHVRGRLVATRVEDQRWSVRVEVAGDDLAFPLLLDPSWAGTGSMAESRVYHSVVLLPNGKVLVAGGEGRASAELYDPVTGTYAATGAMSVTRSGFTLIALGNGKVLAAGGRSGATWRQSAELYDPATGTFSVTGALPSARAHYAAVTLANGKVLLAAGLQSDVPIGSAALYDPALGTFSATGSMGTPRWLHTATRLPSGKVLVAGGRTANPADNGTPTAELYDPNTGTFGATGALGGKREQHSAFLLGNGKVLIAGGVSGGLLPGAEVYDPQLGTFSATGSMSVARIHHGAVLLGTGKVLFMGGTYNNPDQPKATAGAELYDPATGAFSSTASMVQPRRLFEAVRLANGKVLAVGGAFGDWPSISYTATSEIYEPCDVGVVGPACQYSDAVTCNGHGVASADGSCTCNAPWIGAGCQYSDATTCSSNGVAQANGSCVCAAGFVGASCQYSNALTCNSNGVAQANGSCVCAAGFAGASCQHSNAVTCNGNGVAQANGSCVCAAGFAGASCQYSNAVQCNGNGAVQADGSCACAPGFVAPTCTCFAPTTCNGQGTCTSAVGTCMCSPGYAGARCQFSDAVTCSGHGVAQSNGSCACEVPWGGTNCGVCAAGYAGSVCQYSDAATCSGHGVAQASGSCVCATGFAGAACDACAAGYSGYPACKPEKGKPSPEDASTPATPDASSAAPPPSSDGDGDGDEAGDSGGCSASPRRAGESSPLVLLAVVALAGARRRRSRL